MLDSSEKVGINMKGRETTMHKKKSSKTASKLLAAMLTAAMSLTLLPTTALAVEGSTRAGESGLVLNKTATLEDDGTYTIQLEAFSTGETLTVLKLSLIHI